MTNLKKIGLTALAGTLAATTFAQAVEVSVNGTARMEYETRTSNSAGADATALDLFTTNQSVTFSASGELDNGFVIGYSNLLTDGANFTSNMVKVDMGDMGTLSMDSHMHLTGISSIQDKVPNAGEQVWDDTGATAHGDPANGIVDLGADDTLGYKVSASGLTFSAGLSLPGNGSESSATIVADGLVDGLEIGAGMGNNQNAATDDDVETYFIKYAGGPVTVGAQKSKLDAETANTDVSRTGYGISVAVNESMSISYGISDTDYDASATDEENDGVSASYTAGGMTFGLVHNKKDNANGTAGNDHEVTELKLTFAF
jgi:outer membrane protein OmpU